MSFAMMAWALRQPIKPSSAKFVLIALAEVADTETRESFPSVDYIAESTSQDRKTVIENLKRLIEKGLIVDTGARRGRTGQVPVYQIIAPETIVIEGSRNRVSSKAPRKEYRKRNSTEFGTVPNSGSKGPEFPIKESRISVETVPKTGHGTYKEPIKEPVKEPEGRADALAAGPPGLARKETAKDLTAWLLDLRLPEWIDPDDWAAWVAHRRRCRTAPTIKVFDLNLETLAGLRRDGYEPGAVIRRSIERGWMGLFPPRDGDGRGSAASGAPGGRGPNGPGGRQGAVERHNAELLAEMRRKRAGQVPPSYEHMTEAQRADFAHADPEPQIHPEDQ